VDARRPTSSRIALARLAERVVAADPGVSPAEGGLWLTRDGDRLIPGVVVAAGAGGRVDVSLHLVAHLPPRPLELQVATLRAELVEAARTAGLGERLGPIDVTIHDLRQPGAEGMAA
jgi:hypothetical protein